MVEEFLESCPGEESLVAKSCSGAGDDVWLAGVGRTEGFKEQASKRHRRPCQHYCRQVGHPKVLPREHEGRDEGDPPAGRRDHVQPEKAFRCAPAAMCMSIAFFTSLIVLCIG